MARRSSMVTPLQAPCLPVIILPCWRLRLRVVDDNTAGRRMRTADYFRTASIPMPCVRMEVGKSRLYQRRSSG
jgi:hypothetical protein